MTSRYAHLLALVALVMLVASGPAFAQTDYDSDNDRLIDITTLAQLNAIRWDLNGDGVVDTSASATDSTAYVAAFSNPTSNMGCPATGCNGYELMNNLNFDANGDDDGKDSGDHYYNGGAGWTPIARATYIFSHLNFTAIFEGNNYTINALYINRTTTDTPYMPVGLFGYVRGATIRNVGLTNVDISGTAYKAYVGALVGGGQGIRVSGCHVTGTVSSTFHYPTGAGAGGQHYTGGLIGADLVGAVDSVTSSYASVTVSVHSTVPGTAPHARADISVGGLMGQSATVTSSYATGDVSVNLADSYVGSPPQSNTVQIGGLMGRNKGTVTSSYATGTVTVTADDAQAMVGGLVGRSQSGINSSRATGNVNATTGSDEISLRIGGLVGRAEAGITSSHATGNVVGTADYRIYFGGLVGELIRNGTVTSSYATGNVTGSGPNSNRVMGGGLLGYMLSATLNGGYATGTVTGSSTGANSISYTGGLVGFIAATSTPASAASAINSAYAIGNVSSSATGTSSRAYAGALIGAFASNSTNVSSINATYAIGNVTATGDATTNTGFIVAKSAAAIVTDSYWNTASTGIADDAGDAAPEGKTTSVLQTPTGYTDIYMNWNQNLDGQPGDDDPWTFGTSSQYPVLKYSGMDTTAQFAAQTAVKLVLTPSTINESGPTNQTTVTATLNKALNAAVTITVADAVAGDFTLSSANTLTIAASVTTSTGIVTITAVNDTTDAPDKRVTVSGVMSNDQGVGVTSATLTITDDDPAPTVTMAVAPASILENGAISTVTATLSHPSSAATTITVSVTPVQPAVAGDYTLSTADTLLVAAGQTTSTGTVTITTVDNAVTSGNKTVTVSSTVGNSVGAGSVTDATLTIIDDEVPQVTLVLSPASISENGAVSTITATLDRTVTEATTITVSAEAVSPAEASDFTLSGATTLTIAANVTTSTGSVTITAVNDTTDAPDKRVTVSATVAGGNMASLSSVVTLTITDDEVAPTVTLVLMPSSISENGGVSTVSATLSHPSSAVTTITVSAEAVSPATASDFTLSSADTLIIAASETTSTGTVTITAVDNDARADEKTVTVSATANNTQGINDPSDVTLTITDDETPSANLDVDGDGRVRLFSDIILVIRYVLFFREEALLRGNVIEQQATRTTAQEIEPYLDILVNQNILDVDGDGDVRLFSDIILIIRYVLFFRNEALLRGNVIEQQATRTTAQQIEPFIRSLYPDSHFQ